MANRSRCFGAVALAAFTLAAGISPPLAQAASLARAPHRLGCVLIDGRLYLGSPGAGPNPRFVVCGIQLEQVIPRSDGVIVVLAYRHRRSSYSILKAALPVPPVGRQLLGWRHRRSSATVRCSRVGRRLFLGDDGPARHRVRATCSVRFYQLSPDADGVQVVLRSGRYRSAYSIVLRRLPHRARRHENIPWST